uniref:Uncharacterized protein n=1 Tax=Picea glauca TaxID=3330 RepID=A0A101LTR1_PICGL|nr:hypothetical protein ABT39_MTgene3589 [Picea glauca]
MDHRCNHPGSDHQQQFQGFINTLPEAIDTSELSRTRLGKRLNQDLRSIFVFVYGGSGF